MAKSQTKPITPASLDSKQALRVLRTLQERGSALLSKRPLETSEAQAWASTGRETMIKAFGSDSANLCDFEQVDFYRTPKVDSPAGQEELRAEILKERLSVVVGCIGQLELFSGEADGIKGVYQPGEEYEFYRDVTACLKLAQKEIFIIDPYLSVEIFNVYAGAIPRTVSFRLLSASIPADVKNLAQKYATGGNLDFRSSTSIHDRVLFADNRVWLSGQSLKDAARKKPTYIVEHDEPLMRPTYEQIWSAASTVI
jgi:hypothetical protein